MASQVSEVKECRICKHSQQNSRKRNWIACSSCASWFHCSCVNLTKAMADSMPLWACGDCNGQNTQSMQVQSGAVSEEIISSADIGSMRKIKIIKRIPKSARYLAADALSKILSDCARKNDVVSWNKYFLFCFVAFRCPDDFLDGFTLTQTIKNQISEFGSCEGVGVEPKRSNNVALISMGTWKQLVFK